MASHLNQLPGNPGRSNMRPPRPMTWSEIYDDDIIILPKLSHDTIRLLELGENPWKQ